MTGSGGRTVLLVNGRVLELPAVRSAQCVRLEGSVAWWSALAFLGGALVALGACVGAGLGSAAAITGVVLFLATGVLLGSERYEYATVVGVSAVLWTSAGIAVYLGTDGLLIDSLVVFALVGIAALVAGSLGAARARSKEALPSRAAPSP